MVDTEQLVHEPDEAEGGDAEEGVAISLSGGGYRAMLFHAGVLWRLGEMGFFSGAGLRRYDAATDTEVPVGKLERISSVSGGSIVSAVLGLNYSAFVGLSGADFVARYENAVVAPVRALARKTLAGPSAVGAWQVIKDVILPGRVNDHIVRAYDKALYKGKTLQDLPDAVRFVINASNLQSGALWRFSKPYIWDWKVGKIKSPTTPLARAVGASSAFPPVLAPAVLTFANGDYAPNTGHLQRPPFTTHPALADGGVYDNLGLETCFKRYKTLLVSNAGKPFGVQERVKSNWVSIGARCLDVMDNQVLAQRKRQLLDALVSKQRYGAFWDIQQDIVKHPCHQTLPCPFTQTAQLAMVPTDLAKKEPLLQERLINWGYANADAAIRAWFNRQLPPPAGFPYPASGV